MDKSGVSKEFRRSPLWHDLAPFMEPYLAIALACLLMVAGILGSLVPALPSTPLVFLGGLMHFLWMGERSVPTSILIIMAVLMVLSLALEYLASAMGARKLGATWRGVLGATLGGIVGFFFGLPGWILGPMLGALLFERLGGHSTQKAAKAGIGALLGIMAGALGKFVTAWIMVLIFMGAWLWKIL